MRIGLAFLMVLLMLSGALAAGVYLLTRISKRSSSGRTDT